MPRRSSIGRAALRFAPRSSCLIVALNGGRRNLMAKRRRNMWPFSSTRIAPASERSGSRRSGLPLASAAREAHRAGYRGVDFNEWLDRKGLADRSSGVISRLGNAYRAGIDQKDAEEHRKDRDRAETENRKFVAKLKAREAQDRRASERDAAEDRRQKTRRTVPVAAETKAEKAAAKYDLDTGKLAAHYARGGTLAEFLRSNPARGNPIEAETYSREGAEAAARELKQQHHTGVKIIKRARHGRYPYTEGPPNKPGRKSTQDVIYVVTSRGQLKRNPSAAAADAFEEFHGHPSTELLTVKQKVHHHTHLAAAGKLKALRVKPINHGPLRSIKGLGSAVLAFNEGKNQLFVRGGDQSMDKAELKRFGISQVHELETLGRLTGIDYHTNKTHLGDEGGEATYDHGFRMTNENGKHVVVKIARYPDLIYRVLDEQFEFSGGSYTILAEGIDR